jgi:hypothetical protein
MTDTTLQTLAKLRIAHPSLSAADAHFVAHLMVDHYFLLSELQASPCSPFESENLSEWREGHRLLHKLFPHKVSHCGS